MITPTTKAIEAEINRTAQAQARGETLGDRLVLGSTIAGLKKALTIAELGHGTGANAAIGLVIATIDTWANLRGPRVGCLCGCTDTDGMPCGCGCGEGDIEYDISGADAIDALSDLAQRAAMALTMLDIDGAA